jgi:hypothetical protein
MTDDRDAELRPRWRGQPGRLEVHYLTATDPASGTGVWLHHEVVAPTAGDAYAHGWFATFPPDAAPSYVRFGPTPAQPGEATGGTVFRCGEVEMTTGGARGTAGGRTWELDWAEPGGPPIYTFPRWAWRRQVLPAAQIVPAPSTHVTGTVDGRPYAGPAALAHIYGHGNAQRWVWLHADLGDGDVLELVAATARRPGLRALPPLPLVQLRTGGADWPRDPLAAAPLFRASVRTDSFRIRGMVGNRRLTAEVSLPPDRCVALGYTDPDGETATCTNTERADARVRLDRLGFAGWHTEREWMLDGTAHAEIGRRP